MFMMDELVITICNGLICEELITCFGYVGVTNLFLESRVERSSQNSKLCPYIQYEYYNNIIDTTTFKFNKPTSASLTPRRN